MQVLLPETILGTDGVVTTLSIGSPKMHSKKKSIGLSIPITEVKKSTRKFLQSQKNSITRSRKKFTRPGFEGHKKDIARFRKKPETVTQLNIARRNMLNWVQPELILTRNIILLSSKFLQVKIEAMDSLRACVTSNMSRNSMSNSLDLRLVRRSIQRFNIKPRMDSKRSMKLHFCLDLVFKRFLKNVFLEIQDYRHQNAMENFEFQIMYFNKFTQTYQYNFKPIHASEQTEEELGDNQKEYKLHWLCHFVELKRELAKKSSFMAIRTFNHNKDLDELNEQIDEKQRKIHRKKEWESITDLKKADAKTKFFLTCILNLFERSTIARKMEAFDKIEHQKFNFKLRKIAINNMITFALHSVSIEFQRFRVNCFKEKQKLHFDHSSVVKGLFVLKTKMEQLINTVWKKSLNKIRLETRQRSRRSLIGVSRPSVNTKESVGKIGEGMTHDERITDGSEALRYIFRRQMIANLRQFKIFFKYDTNFSLNRADAFTGHMYNVFQNIRKRMFMMMKRMSEARMAKTIKAHRSLMAIENLFHKRTEIYTAFYYLKHSRTIHAHSQHIRLGCFFLNKVSLEMFSRQKKSSFLEMKHEFAMNMSMMFSGLKFMKKDGNTDGLKPEGEDGDQSQALEEKVGGELGEGLEDNPEENNIAVENNLTGSAFITKESNAGGEEGESPGGKPTTKGKKEKGGQSQTPSKFATGDKKGQVAKPDPKKPEEKQKAGGGASASVAKKDKAPPPSKDTKPSKEEKKPAGGAKADAEDKKETKRASVPPKAATTKKPEDSPKKPAEAAKKPTAPKKK